MNLLDYVLITLYSATVLAIGIAARKRISSSLDFFLAGRGLPAWITGLAFVSANLGAIEILGMAANGAQYGAMTVHYYWIGAVPAMVFLGIVMMPFYYRSKVRSVPEFLRRRFNGATQLLNAITPHRARSDQGGRDQRAGRQDPPEPARRARPAHLGRHRRPEPHAGALDRHRVRARLRAVVRLLDDELRRDPAGPVGQEHERGPADADRGRVPEDLHPAGDGAARHDRAGALQRPRQGPGVQLLDPAAHARPAAERRARGSR
ncbi:sodium:solute symporter family transporter [Nonomuraea coxensis]|uniref:sodium:solute symporter family transporter n=1 Tax=Nonomuraea coxensis TaxID=404386 RepID=UPI001FE57E37|nr:hypothetical protein [Nonomuraea coxensis]